jgi:predicted DNA-binding transcriptional regulator YafY
VYHADSPSYGIYYHFKRTYVLFSIEKQTYVLYNMINREGTTVRGLLLNALAANEPVEIIYLSEKGQLSQRVVVLEAIESTYIKAFCNLRKQRRIFKLSNILSIRLAKNRRKRKWVS